MPDSLRIFRKDGIRSSRESTDNSCKFGSPVAKDSNKDDRLSSIKWISLCSCGNKSGMD